MHRLFFLTFFVFNLFTHVFAKPADLRSSAGYVLTAGNWRGHLLRQDGHAVSFNFSVRQSFGRINIYIINGTERLLVDNVHQLGDSVFIVMPFFDSRFALRLTDEKNLSGSWIKNYGDHLIVMPFVATYKGSDSSRLGTLPKPLFNISGRWSVLFRGPSDSTLAIGEFRQSGAQVRGTFLTTTGDYRYLDGAVSGDTLRLSTFDGGHAYSFESRILDTNKMTGFYFAGATHVETWTAEKNELAKLPDEYSLTRLKNSSDAVLHFKLPDLNGQLVSLSDPSFKNKVVIVQILGSWCPNCMDETRFLSAWYIQNKSRGIAIVGLAYERTASFADTKKLLQPFITRFHVTYPILATGVTIDDSLRTEKTIPEIEQIVGFPTTIFIDKKGAVRKIYTGFNGPGTGEHYEAYKKEFNDLVNSLLGE
jgi:thiol-disulfide isomerase/thioredoxin